MRKEKDTPISAYELTTKKAEPGSKYSHADIQLMSKVAFAFIALRHNNPDVEQSRVASLFLLHLLSPTKQLQKGRDNFCTHLDMAATTTSDYEKKSAISAINQTNFHLAEFEDTKAESPLKPK